MTVPSLQPPRALSKITFRAGPGRSRSSQTPRAPDAADAHRRTHRGAAGRASSVSRKRCGVHTAGGGEGPNPDDLPVRAGGARRERLYRACSLTLRRGRPQWHPDIAQARRGVDYIGRRGRTPEIASRRTAAAPLAVPAPHVRSHKSAGRTVLTTPRSWQFTSTTGRRRASPSIPPYFFAGVAGGVAKYLRGSRSVLRHTQATCDPPGEVNLGSYFLSDLELIRIRTGYSSVLRSAHAPATLIDRPPAAGVDALRLAVLVSLRVLV